MLWDCIHLLLRLVHNQFFFAGVVMTFRVGAAEPMSGNGYATYAIAACIIGGTSFLGGEGKITGLVIVGLIIGTRVSKE